MRDVAAFAGFAETITFDRLRQNYRRLSFVFDSGFECGINFFRIMATTTEPVNLVIAKMVYHLG